MGNEKQVRHGISGTSWKNGRCGCDECREAGRRHAQTYWAERKAKIEAGTFSVDHGTNSAYSQGCRCSDCKAANAEYQRWYRKNRLERIAGGEEFAHGTTSGYNYGCRCISCRAAGFVVDNKIDRANIDVIIDLYRDHDGRCEICGSEEKLNIDHDHATGHVRGLLCRGCNTGIGMFKDSVEYLEGAIRYLARGSS